MLIEGTKNGKYNLQKQEYRIVQRITGLPFVLRDYDGTGNQECFQSVLKSFASPNSILRASFERLSSKVSYELKNLFVLIQSSKMIGFIIIPTESMIIKSY